MLLCIHVEAEGSAMFYADWIAHLKFADCVAAEKWLSALSTLSYTIFIVS